MKRIILFALFPILMALPFAADAAPELMGPPAPVNPPLMGPPAPDKIPPESKAESEAKAKKDTPKDGCPAEIEWLTQ